MNVLVCRRPGLFEYEERSVPEEKENAAIIKIRRIGICGTDLHAYEGTQPYFTYPRILGHELSGEIVSAPARSGLAFGQQVTVIPYLHCNECSACRAGKTNCCVRLQVSGVHVDGGMVEYFQVPTSYILPGMGLSLEELAMIEPYAIGAHSIKRANVSAGETVLVVGAGPIGLAVLASGQIAEANLICMDINPARLGFAKQLFPKLHIIDAHSGLLQEQLAELTNGEMPGVVIDATGNRNAIENSFQYLSHGGRFVLVGIQKENISFSHPEFHRREATLMSSRNALRSDFEFVMNAMLSGQLNPTKLITHKVDFKKAASAFAQLLTGDAGVIKAMIEL